MAKTVATQPGTSVTVGTSSVTVFSADSSVIEITFCNDSDTPIYLKLGSPAVLNTGIRLNAGGGTYTTNDYNGQVTAICSATGKILTVVAI